MTHDEIQYHVQHHVALRFIRKDHAPLMGAFLQESFKSGNRTKVPEIELTDLLQDFLGTLHYGREEKVYPLSPKDYLTQWTQNGFLRKEYEKQSDIPVYQLTSGCELALKWLASLDKKSFVGTESRLLHIIRLLEDMVQKTQTDPAEKVKLLKKQKEALDREIDELSRADGPIVADETQIKERFFELERTAVELLADFREVEENFHGLDQRAREKQLRREIARGQVVGEVLDAYDELWASDQGKSFAAFWELLMNNQQQESLDEMLREVKSLPHLPPTSHNSIISRLKINLIEAGDQVNRSSHRLVGQLRRFLDAQVLMENKRMMETIHELQELAVEGKNDISWRKPFFSIDGKPRLNFTLNRPLFTPPARPVISSEPVEEGRTEQHADRTNLLFEQVYVDPQELKRRIRKLLRSQAQVTLREVTEHYPVEKGLKEVLVYLDIASKDRTSLRNEEIIENIAVSDVKYSSQKFYVEVPQLIFSRHG